MKDLEFTVFLSHRGQGPYTCAWLESVEWMVNIGGGGGEREHGVPPLIR